MINIKFHANWCSDAEIREHFNRCTINHDYTWKNLYLTAADDYDFYIIMNYPQHVHFDPARTIIFQSEPEPMRKHWEYYYKPEKELFFKVFDIENHHNVDKWYINLNYTQLANLTVPKTKTLSGIVSGLTYYPGHQNRVNFLKYLDRLPYYDHYGRGDLRYLKTWRGPLANKEDGLTAYKYHFNAENCHERNYFTEKILDAILCESLCFYDGCPNLDDFIDPYAYIKIDVTQPEEAIEIIQSAIASNEYEKRLESIRQAKQKLMTELNPLNLVYNIIYNRRNGSSVSIAT